MSAARQFPTGRSSDGANIAQEAQNVNEVDKLGNVLAYDISDIRKSTGRGLDGSVISADALDQSIDKSSIPNNPQDVNDENSHITCSMESAEANQYNTKKNELKSSWNRAEGQFNDQTRLNLHHSQYSSNTIVLEQSVVTVGDHTPLEEEHVHIMEEYRSGCMSEKSETKLVLVIILIIVIISVALVFDMKRQDEIRKLENQSFTNLSNGLADFGSAWSKLTDEAKATYPCEELVIEENKSMCKEFRGFAIERIRKGK